MSYFVWVGTTMRSVLFMSLAEARKHRDKLVSEGYRNVSIQNNGEQIE